MRGGAITLDRKFTRIEVDQFPFAERKIDRLPTIVWPEPEQFVILSVNRAVRFQPAGILFVCPILSDDSGHVRMGHPLFDAMGEQPTQGCPTALGLVLLPMTLLIQAGFGFLSTIDNLTGHTAQGLTAGE